MGSHITSKMSRGKNELFKVWMGAAVKIRRGVLI
jgi:hypothetical protein